MHHQHLIAQAQEYGTKAARTGHNDDWASSRRWIDHYRHLYRQAQDISQAIGDAVATAYDDAYKAEWESYQRKPHRFERW